MLLALHYIHSKDIIHRDLKPSNILIESLEKGNNKRTYQIKVIDFGLATSLNKLRNNYSACGTPGFLAPELLRCKRYDHRVDVFGAGCIVYSLLTGKSLINGTSVDETLMNNYHFSVEHLIHGESLDMEYCTP